MVNMLHSFGDMLLVCLLTTVPYGHAEKESGFYTHVAQDIESMEDVSLSQFKDKVLLVVNVASECGYTDEHYKELVELQNKFHVDRFQVLAFPCNQFGKQEPKKNAQIHRFAQDTYHVNFQMFTKLKTIGEKAHPIYKWLKQASGGYEPNWNFCKYLLDWRGRVRRFATPMTPAIEMAGDIEKLINGEDLEGEVYNESYRDEL